MAAVIAKLVPALLLITVAQLAGAQEAPSPAELRDFVLGSAQPAAQANPAARIEVDVGELNPRLRLAPCRRIEPHLPPGSRLWGQLRLGLRCAEGEVKWNVYLPVTVKAWVPGVVATGALRAGSVIQPGDLVLGEVDIARDGAVPVLDPARLVGRTLNRPMAAGDAVGPAALKPKQWFAAGDQVRVVAVGNGYAVSSSGEALGPGIEGQPARIRTESGRVITGTPVAERRVEIRL